MYKKQKKSWVKHLDFLLLDILCLEAAFLLSYLIKLQDDSSMMIIRRDYSRLAVLLILMDLCLVFLFEAYTGILRRNKLQELRATVIHCSTVFLALILYIWATKQAEIYSRQILFVFFALSVFLEYFLRCVWKRIIRYRMLHGERFNKLIIITEERNAIECVKSFQYDRYKEFEVNGIVIVDEDCRGERICGVPVVASADSCLEYIRAHVVDEVFINGHTRESSEALASELLELGVTVHFNLVQASDLRPNKIVEQCGRYMVLTSSMKIASTRQLVMKRAMDLAGSVIGLVFMLISFLIFAPIIKIQSPGPIFYAQIRVGKNGRRFKFYKFRTMVVGADAMKIELD